MSLIRAKQVLKFLQASINIGGLSFAAGSSAVITSALTTAATTAGDGGVAVPVQVGSATQEGFITSGNNIVQVWSTATGAKMADAGGNEVYGRLTGTYTLSLYSLVAGVETAYTAAATTLNIEVPYNFSFEHFPSDALVGMVTRYVSNDPAGGTPQSQSVTVTGVDTLAALAVAPDTTKEVILNVNGQMISSLITPAPFSIAGTTITWSAVNAGFSLDTTDKVVAEYRI